MSMNADPNASFSLSTWILKSPIMKTLSAASTNSDRKSPNYLIKSVWCPGGLYAVADGYIISFYQYFISILPKTKQNTPRVP